MSWSQEVVEEMFRRHRAEAIPWIEDRTVVVCELVAGGIPVPNFSAVLLQVVDQCFVVTAAHCLEGWGPSRFLITLPDNDYVDLTTVQAQIPRDECIDFGLLPLTDEMAKKLARFKSFVRLSELDVEGSEPREGRYTLLGYPIKLRKQLENDWVCSALVYPTVLTTAADVDRDQIITLFRDVEHTNEDGERDKLPELEGISGCGIWRVHAKGEDPRTWSVDRIRLAGIEYGYLKQAILGVRAKHVIAGVATQFPQLEPAVSLIGIRILRPATASDQSVAGR